MGTELVKTSSVSIPATITSASLPELVERAGGAARFAWEEFFYAEHHNPHTQKAYMAGGAAVPGLGRGAGGGAGRHHAGDGRQYLVGLGGSPAKRNLHLAALRGFFDRLVNRHVCILNPAASVRGVKDQVVEGKTPEITIEQARTLLASIKLSRKVKTKQGETVEVPLLWACVIGRSSPRWPIPPAGPGRWPSCGCGDFQHDGQQYVLRFQEKGGKSREIPVRHDLEGIILAYVEAAGISGEAKESPLFRASNGRSRETDGEAAEHEADMRAGQAAAERRRAAVAAVAAFLPGDGDHRPAEQGVPMEDVQYLAGHAEPRTTTLYDRRKKKVTRNIVERIPI